MKNFELTEEVALEIGSVIKKRREELNYSTNYIEIHTGINKADLSRIENGKKKKINPIYLKELSKVLKLNQIELFAMAGFIDLDYMEAQEINIDQLDPIEMMVIPIFSSVAAGMGYIPDAEPIDFITIPTTTGECVGIKVSGDSMEPTFFNQDIIVLKKEVEVGLGEIGVFLDKTSGESLVKRLKKKNGVFVLESDNHIFKDIEIKTDEIVCCGKVINVIKKDLKKRENPLQQLLDKIPGDKLELAEKLLKTLIPNEK